MSTLQRPTPLDPLQERYFALIDRLLACPNGEEPKILNTEPNLLTPGFVQALMQTASYFAHQDNADAARFLIFVARELSVQLGLYPDPEAGSNLDPELVSQSSQAANQTARPGVL
ncbi:MAG: hypothetical protein AAFV85_13880 [Cyanobacteria bacterium J06634_6]